MQNFESPTNFRQKLVSNSTSTPTTVELVEFLIKLTSKIEKVENQLTALSFLTKKNREELQKSKNLGSIQGSLSSKKLSTTSKLIEENEKSITHLSDVFTGFSRKIKSLETQLKAGAYISSQNR